MDSRVDICLFQSPFLRQIHVTDFILELISWISFYNCNFNWGLLSEQRGKNPFRAKNKKKSWNIAQFDVLLEIDWDASSG